MSKFIDGIKENLLSGVFLDWLQREGIVLFEKQPIQVIGRPGIEPADQVLLYLWCAFKAGAIHVTESHCRALSAAMGEGLKLAQERTSLEKELLDGPSGATGESGGSHSA